MCHRSLPFSGLVEGQTQSKPHRRRVCVSCYALLLAVTCSPRYVQGLHIGDFAGGETLGPLPALLTWHSSIPAPFVALSPSLKMRRTLLLVALVVLVAVVVPSALAHQDGEEEHADNVIYHTGTYEELGVLLKELEALGPKKRAEEAAAKVAEEAATAAKAKAEVPKPPTKKEEKKPSSSKPSTDSKPKTASATKPKASADSKSAKNADADATPKPGQPQHTQRKNAPKTPPKNEEGASTSASSKRKNQIKFAHVRRIIQSDPTENMYPMLKRDNRPTIVHNTPISNSWPAFDLWDFEYFANRWGTSRAMGPISVSNGTRASGMHETVLVYHNFTEYTAWPGVPKATKEVAMNLGTFFSGQCQKQTEDTWWWMRAMFTLNDTLVESQVQPMDYFVNPEARNKTEPLASMVTSSMNGKFQLHYETDDMWIVNIHQRQQVLLFSPEEMQKLYLFPFTHPYTRRSQVLPLTDATDAKYPGISDVKGLEALLEPREVLYIPKYWGYHIINVAPSISLHISTKDVFEKSLGQWDFKMNFVGLAQLPPAKRLTAAKFAVRRVIQPLLDMDNWEKPSPEFEGADPPETYQMKFENKVLRAFIRKHVQQRYSKLPNYSKSDQTKQELYDEVRDACRAARKDGPLEPIENARFAPTLDGVVYNLYQHTDLSIRHLQMHDWLDFIAWSAFGDHNKMEAFLMRCF